MRLMVMVLAALAAACSGERGGATAAPPPDEAEVPRAPVELLVERFTRGGVHSWYTMSPDGTQVAPFAGIPEDARAAVPSPDGRTLALLRATGEGVHLWLMDRDGGSRRPLVEGIRDVHEVSWSPDGARLVYSASTVEETGDLWVIGADGTGARRVTSDPLPAIWYDRAPAWSPDGARIAFASNRSGGWRLWLVAADGADAVQVLPPALDSSERAPAWSADGGLLAFESATPEGGGIGLVRPDGTGYRRFAPGGDVGRPAWSPDGRVLYTTDRTGDLEIFALDPATGATENLTRHSTHDLRAVPFRRPPLPAWRGLDAPRRFGDGAAGTPGMACGDVIADGVPDLVLLDPAAARLKLLRGTGGGFASIGTLDASLDQRALSVEDVSGDGVKDAVVLATAALWVWRGGAGGPGLPDVHELPGAGRAMAIADLDDDGAADVVVVHERAGSPFHVRVHSASPVDGTLVAVVDLAADRGGAGQACSGDVTGEGAVDLVVLTPADGSALLFPGHGDITFGLAGVAASGLALDAEAIPLCVDLDGDRRADLALLRPGAAAGLSVHRSAGAGFAPAALLPAAGTSVAAADLDRDGDQDLLVAGPGASAVLFLRNLGDGRFARPVRLDVGGSPLRVLVADLDGDGLAGRRGGGRRRLRRRAAEPRSRGAVRTRRGPSPDAIGSRPCAGPPRQGAAGGITNSAREATVTCR